MMIWHRDVTMGEDRHQAYRGQTVDAYAGFAEAMVSISDVVERLFRVNSSLLEGDNHAQDCGLRVYLVGWRDSSAGWCGRRYGWRLRLRRVDAPVLARRHGRALL